MKKIRKFLIIILVVIVVQILLNWFFRCYYNPVPQYPKTRICETLKPGITISELNKALGIPASKGVTEKGEVWFSYASDQYASVPIKARIDQDTGLVLELRCGEGPPNWILNPEMIEE